MLTWSRVPAFSRNCLIFFSFEAAYFAFIKASVSYFSTLRRAQLSKSLCTSSSISLKFSSSLFSFTSSIGLTEATAVLWSVEGLLLNPADAFDFIAVPRRCWAVPLIAVPIGALLPNPPALFW